MMKIFSLLALLLPATIFGQVGTIINNLQASAEFSEIINQQALSEASSYQSQAKESAIANIPANAAEPFVRKYYALACIYYSTNGVSNPRTLEQLGDIVLPRWTTEDNWLVGEPCNNWFGISCNAAGEVTTIELDSNDLYGTFPPEIVFLNSSLQVLELFDNFFLHTLGDAGNRWIGEMAALVNLFFGTTSFEYDGVPTWLNGATNLRELDFSNTYWTEGPIRPEAFAALDQLEYLEMSDNIYSTNTGGTVQTSIDLPVMESLANVYMQRCDFRPTNVDLSFLTKMPVLNEAWLDFTKFDGGIPATLGTSAPILQSLSLSFCGLDGPIPANLGSTQLKQMWLNSNELTGDVPSTLGNLADLKIMYLEGNLLGTGEPNAPHSLPVEICALPMDELGVDCDRVENPGFVKCTCCKCCAGDCGNFPDPSPAPTQFPTFAPVLGCSEGLVFIPGVGCDVCPDGTFFLPRFGCICFSGDSKVDVKDVGPVELRNLKIGDSVKVTTATDKYEPVYSFGHYSPEETGNFIELATGVGNKITISAHHMIEQPGGIFVPAHMIHAGSSLIMENGVESRVVSVKMVQSQGLYAPFTPSGKIIVDGISASCYVAFDKESSTMTIFGGNVSFQWLAHSFQFPHRLFCYYLGQCTEQYSQRGISAWVETPLRISQLVLSIESDAIKSFLFAIAVAIVSLFNLVEMVVFQFPVLLLLGVAAAVAYCRSKTNKKL